MQMQHLVLPHHQPPWQGSLADSQKVVATSPRASGGWAEYTSQFCHRVVGVLDGQDQFIVESGKRALNMMAEGMKRLLCGDNSGGR
jgi:hypothetical protein